MRAFRVPGAESGRAHHLNEGRPPTCLLPVIIAGSYRHHAYEAYWQVVDLSGEGTHVGPQRAPVSALDDLHAAITRAAHESGLEEDWLVGDFVVVAASQSLEPGREGFYGMSYLTPPSQPHYRTLGLLHQAVRKHDVDVTTFSDGD